MWVVSWAEVKPGNEIDNPSPDYQNEVQTHLKIKMP